MASRKKCKNCDRPVQPGLTKTLTEYDTCCRSCANAPGTGKHDANCGGAYRVNPSQINTAEEDPSVILADLVANPDKLDSIATAAFDAAANGHARLGTSQLRTALKELMEPFGTGRVSAKSLKEEFDEDEDGLINREEFLNMASEVVAREHRLWFPVTLPLSSTSFVVQNPNSLEDEYALGKFLGEGTFGKVFMCTHKVSGEVRVAKKVSIEKAGMDVDEILGEISNMAMLDHPNVVKVYEWFEDDSTISQIMEPLGGGELQARIEAVFQKGTSPFYGEPFIADVIKQTLRALAFMHSRRFMHKDLKPQNIMMTDKESSSIKVIDFGMAEFFPESQHRAGQFGGTLLYLAPEGARQMLGFPDKFGFNGLVFKSDIWSTGVILYQLITGALPFCGTWPPPRDDIDAWQVETLQAVVNNPFPQHASFSNVSKSCIEMCKTMLEKPTASRPDASQCLSNAWFTNAISAPAPLSPGIMQSLYAYSGVSELKKAIFFLMADLSSIPAVAQLREIYTQFDVRNSGTIAKDDLRGILQQGGMRPFEIQRILQALDRNQKDEIVWTEFLAGALCFKLAKSTKLINAAFDFFDESQSGMISIEDVENRLAVDPVPAHWQAVWQEQLPEEFESVKKDFPEGETSSICPFLCASREAGDEEISKEVFQSWMGQKLKQKSGDSYFTVD